MLASVVNSLMLRFFRRDAYQVLFWQRVFKQIHGEIHTCVSMPLALPVICYVCIALATEHACNGMYTHLCVCVCVCVCVCRVPLWRRTRCAYVLNGSPRNRKGRTDQQTALGSPGRPPTRQQRPATSPTPAPSHTRTLRQWGWDCGGACTACTYTQRNKPTHVTGELCVVLKCWRGGRVRGCVGWYGVTLCVCVCVCVCVGCNGR